MQAGKKYKAQKYDVIVVGAGHAGCEAALASARMGNQTLLITINLEMTAFMPCNPSIGGPAKGVVVREIDALGGEMGFNADKTYMQMLMLNTSKGPAVRALRAQIDKRKYSIEMKHTLEKQNKLTLRQGIVDELIVKNNIIKGIITNTGACYSAKTVVLTTGTAARGKIIIGELMYSSGPNNSQPSIKLSGNLKKLGFELKRFKTGTSPRIDGQTVNYSKTKEQPGGKKADHFSFEPLGKKYRPVSKQLSCWLTHTNKKTHKIIYDNLSRAPMFTGAIKGVGPRYCPSIEDKIVRFADKPRHQIFLEPEGKNTSEYYIQGLNTSLPEDVQQKMVHSISGLEKSEIMRPGYAIEYDVIPPYQLRPTLETKLIQGLYTAGQINGTSGYEEAAGQGIIAGINAARKALGKKEIVLKRSDAYIGVMIDDLVTKGTNEPYRLLTSRAENRLIIRHDNADLRLTDLGYKIGLIPKKRYEKFKQKKINIKEEEARLKLIKIKKNSKINDFLKKKGAKPLKNNISASEFLNRPYVSYKELKKFIPEPKNVPNRYVAQQIEIQFKYKGYIEKEQREIKKMKRMESKKIPRNINYNSVANIATEAKQKLSKIHPETFAQASRINGVNPSDLLILSVYIKQGKFI